MTPHRTDTNHTGNLGNEIASDERLTGNTRPPGLTPPTGLGDAPHPGVPTSCTDRDGRLWTWDTVFACYRNDVPGRGTVLSSLADLHTKSGPLTDPPSSWGLGDSSDVRERILTERARPAGNVFEWALEHSRATGVARDVVRLLAWDDHHDSADPPSWSGYRYLDREARPATDLQGCGGDITQAVLELIALGELELHGITDDTDLAWPCPEVTYTFPAYLTWRTHGTLEGNRDAVRELRDAAHKIRVVVAGDGVAEWLRLIRPALGEPLAAWLDQAAVDAEQIGVDRHAITLARAVNK